MLKNITITVILFTFLIISGHSFAIQVKADEIESLERKLEYLKAKKELDLELKIIQKKLDKLNQDYSDIITTKSNNISDSQSATKPKNNNIKDTQPNISEKHQWAVKSIRAGMCRGWKVDKFQLNKDGSFILNASNPLDGGWKGYYEGNFVTQKAGGKFGGARIASFKSNKKDSVWHVQINMGFAGGGGCSITFQVE